MCRLVASVGASVPVGSLIFDGEHALYRQSWAPRELRSGSVNADGYGVAWYDDRPHPSRVAEVRPIWHDDGLQHLLDGIASRCVVAALRNATPGIPVDRSGVLPLVCEAWTFALNGYVPDFREEHMRALRSTLPDDLYAMLTGVSDSETLFLMAIAEVRAGASLREALIEVARRVKSRVGSEEAQLNMVLADGVSLAVIRSATVLETNSLYVAERGPLADGRIVVASEPLDPSGGWSPVDGHTALLASVDGSMSIEPVFLR